MDRETLVPRKRIAAKKTAARKQVTNRITAPPTAPAPTHLIINGEKYPVTQYSWTGTDFDTITLKIVTTVHANQAIPPDNHVPCSVLIGGREIAFPFTRMPAVPRNTTVNFEAQLIISSYSTWESITFADPPPTIYEEEDGPWNSQTPND